MARDGLAKKLEKEEEVWIKIRGVERAMPGKGPTVCSPRGGEGEAPWAGQEGGCCADKSRSVGGIHDGRAQEEHRASAWQNSRETVGSGEAGRGHGAEGRLLVVTAGRKE